MCLFCLIPLALSVIVDSFLWEGSLIPESYYIGYEGQRGIAHLPVFRSPYKQIKAGPDQTGSTWVMIL